MAQWFYRQVTKEIFIASHLIPHFPSMLWFARSLLNRLVVKMGLEVEVTHFQHQQRSVAGFVEEPWGFRAPFESWQ